MLLNGRERRGRVANTWPPLNRHFAGVACRYVRETYMSSRGSIVFTERLVLVGFCFVLWQRCSSESQGGGKKNITMCSHGNGSNDWTREISLRCRSTRMTRSDAASGCQRILECGGGARGAPPTPPAGRAGDAHAGWRHVTRCCLGACNGS